MALAEEKGAMEEGKSGCVETSWEAYRYSKQNMMVTQNRVLVRKKERRDRFPTHLGGFKFGNEGKWMDDGVMD